MSNIDTGDRPPEGRSPRRIQLFLDLVSRSRLSIAGAVLVTTALLADLIVILGELLVFESNPYIGILVWVLLPGLALFGLLLIPFGLWRRLRKSGHSGWSGVQELTSTVERRSVALVVLALTFVNLTVFGTAGYRGLHHMESPSFCGLVCHQVMEPEYNVYRRSPHSEVECVECHVGGGLGHLLKSKLDGTRQLWGVMTGSYSRPIKTPIQNLRPAREVCGACHFPESFHGNMIKVLDQFDSDEANTHRVTVLNMRVGGGTGPNKRASGIHWHTDTGSALRYYASDPEREDILRVEQVLDDGSLRIWTNPDRPMPVDPDPAGYREMDCVDCHNRPTHIFLSPVQAMDQWMADGLLDQEVPWLRSIGEEMLDQAYPTTEAALEGIAQMPSLYAERYPEHWDRHEAGVRASVAVLQDVYQLFVYPEMNLRWNTYSSMIGHSTKHTAACFRCHNGVMRDGDGIAITSECDDCHFVLADREQDPMILRMLEER